VAIGGKQRPADVALLDLDPRGPMAVDIVVHQPLGLSGIRDPTLMKKALADEEDEKARKEALLCHSNGWLFAGMAWHPWGGVGPQGAALLRRIEKALVGELQGRKRSVKISHFRQALSFALMKEVGQQLVEIREAEPTVELPLLCDCPQLPPNTETFAPVETRGWDEPMADDEDGMEGADEVFFVGPIRITTRRAVRAQ
jgi:hypothetical protein